ncbi:MAG: NF038143 family protein [Desulfobacterales bacterium]
MASLTEKSDFIRSNETTFAYSLSLIVIEKPKISVWMILIPIILVYHMYRHKSYVEGRRTFAENFLITRNRALEAAVGSIANEGPLDESSVVKEANIPESTKEEYTAWVRVLMTHYKDLLRCEGDSFDALVRSAYKNKTNYLLFLNILNKSEKRFNSALKPHLQDTTEGVSEIIDRMEKGSEKLRYQEAERIFP